jgi:hypothetical protein
MTRAEAWRPKRLEKAGDFYIKSAGTQTPLAEPLHDR